MKLEKPLRFKHSRVKCLLNSYICLASSKARLEKINSTCIYCVVGCRLNYVVENNAVVKVEPVEEDAVSEGYPCLRGLTVN